jgi:hypothetical protein
VGPQDGGHRGGALVPDKSDGSPGWNSWTRQALSSSVVTPLAILSYFPNPALARAVSSEAHVWPSQGQGTLTWVCLGPKVNKLPAKPRPPTPLAGSDKMTWQAFRASSALLNLKLALGRGLGAPKEMTLVSLGFFSW